MRNSIVSFDNTEIAFSGKTDKDLRRAYWLFKLISYNWLVNISPPFVKFALWAHLPINGLIRATAFRHFCGGETIAECTKTIDELGIYNIGAILDYSVEGKESEQDFDKGLQQILATIRRAKGDKHISFSVFKPTGMARFALLEKASRCEGFEILHSHPSAGLQILRNGQPGSKERESALSPSEREEFKRVRQRFETICRTGVENNVPIFIDAEETWIQDVIDGLVTEMMMKYNKERVMIYNTIQMYRTDRLEFLKKSCQHALQNNYLLGMKIVRGAYLEKERKRAAEKGYPSPVHADKQATDKDYDDSLRFCVEHIDRIAVCAGTHNENSSLLLTELMKEKNLPNDHPYIWFSQLYGMSDHISYNLAKLGYNVCKYVPYGPITAVLPYLIRRTQENTSVAGMIGRELSLIVAEKKRRIEHG